MASILKITITTTADVSSDVLNKEAGALVKDAITKVVPVIIDKLKGDRPSPTPEVKKDEPTK